MRRLCWFLLGLLLCFLSATSAPLRAQPADAFELHDGDRVVFVGDGLIEFEQRSGYIERALTTRWPERNITFRNVGWSGDTVFGEARDHYTNPPTAFEHLVEQITTPRPTVIVFGYGGTLAYEEPETLPAFVEGYHQLLDTLATTGARCVLLAPIPHEQDASLRPDVASLNATLKQVRGAIAEIAAARDCRFVDLFLGMQRVLEQRMSLTLNSIHLHEDGYVHAAQQIEDSFALWPRPTTVTVDLAAGTVEGARLLGGALDGTQLDAPGKTLRFTLHPAMFPTDALRVIAIKGLAAGLYTLTSVGMGSATFPAANWADGVALTHPAELEQVEALRRAIIEKNKLYFRQYRPQNETYLVGFRRYEQGQNAAELEQLTPLIDEKENEIGRLRVPQPLVFTLRRE